MRLPVIPTIVVAIAAAIMVGLGIWQIQRAGEKQQLLADYAHAETLPPLDLDPLIARGTVETVPLAFRRVLVTCRSGDAAPQVRAGHNGEGETGYSYYVPCRPGASGFAGRLSVNSGWSQRPDAAPHVRIDGLVAGMLGAIPKDGFVTLTSAKAAPPLQPSGRPSIEDIPNNHLFYAAQWFFFAAAAVVIYLLALRRRRPPRP